MDEHTHIGYADESHWNEGRYRSIALVTAAIPTADMVSTEVMRVVAESNLSDSAPEFAWKALRTDKTLAVANQMMNITVAAAYSEPFRVDVITWDTHDSRHKLPGRDDTANLARMYYHLMIKVIEDRWPKAAWIISPDERTDMDWAELERCLSYPSRRAKRAQVPLLSEQFYIPYRPPKVTHITSDHPLVQIADLFGGMASFSWNEHESYAAWKSQRSEQPDMFLNAFPRLQQPTIGGGYKSNVLHNFEKKYLQRLRGRDKKEFEKRPKGLVTMDPSMPINFWFYTPQGSYDKAPRRHLGSIHGVTTFRGAGLSNRK